MIIHIGLHKAGTTTLRTSLFRDHAGLDFIGLYEDVPALDDALWQIIGDDTLRFDPPKVKATVDRVLTSRGQTGRQPLVSAKNLSLGDHCDHGILAERVREAFGPAKILFIVRRQDHYLASTYLQWLRAHPSVRVDYANWLEEFFLYSYRSPFARRLRFHTIARKYADLFGRDRVGVFTFEDFLAERASFVSSICRFMGVDPEEGVRCIGRASDANPRDSKAQLAWKRVQARSPLAARLVQATAPAIIRRGGSRLIRGRPLDVSAPERLTMWIQDYCASENEALAREWRLPLSRLGYVTGSTSPPQDGGAQEVSR